MRILVIGKIYPDSFASHIYDTIGDMGHSVEKFELKSGVNFSFLSKSVLGYRFYQGFNMISNISNSIASMRKRKMKPLLKMVEKDNFDLIIITYDFFWPAEVTSLKNLSRAKIAMWFPDAISNLGKSFFMVSPYDALFFKDPFIVKMLKGVLKSKVCYLPECFNPKKHVLPLDYLESDIYKCDITTAGNQHSWRTAIFEHLNDYDIKFWGLNAPAWMPKGILSKHFQGRAVHNEEKACAFLGAKIVLNNLHNSEIWGLAVRCFEAAGIGAFQLVDWRPGLDDLFVDGKEIVSFTTIEDMQDKIKYWLPRTSERLEIALNGKKRAYKEHTYQLRLQLLLDCVFGDNTGFPLPITHI